MKFFFQVFQVPYNILKIHLTYRKTCLLSDALTWDTLYVDVCSLSPDKNIENK